MDDLPDRDALATRPAQQSSRPPRFEPPDYHDERPEDLGASRGFSGRPSSAESRSPRDEPPAPRDQRDFREPSGYGQQHDSGQRPAFGEETSRFDRQSRRQPPPPRSEDTRSGRPRLDETRSDRALPDDGRYGEGRFEETRLDGPRFDETRFDGPRFDETRIEQPRSGSPRFMAGPDDATGRRDALPSPPSGPPARSDWSYREPAGYPGGPGNGYPGPYREGPGQDWGPGPFGMTGGPAGPGAYAPDGPAWGGPPPERRRGRKGPLIIGAVAVVVVIGAGAAVTAPKLLKHTDPGCTSYSATALPAYNHAINDLNKQAPQKTLSTDLSAAISQLTTAVNKAQATTVRTALQGLLTQLTQVQADVNKGTVPASTVSQLNTASSAADSAC